MYIELLDWSVDFHSLFIAVFKVFLALICGGVLGMERGRKKRPAGFRTYMLVCLGATLVMMTNEYLCKIYGTGDVARLGAQVISGIGFLGAGTIITTGHNRVKGLTTAAGMWVAACIGLSIGSGYYEGAILGTVMVAIVMVVLHSFDQRMLKNSKVVILYAEFEKMSGIKRLNTFTKENHIVIDDMELENPGDGNGEKVAAVITLRLPTKNTHIDLLERISAIEGVNHVEEI